MIEIHQPEGCGDITFEHIKLVPDHSDDRRPLGAAQARAIRDLLEWLRDRRSPRPRV